MTIPKLDLYDAQWVLNFGRNTAKSSIVLNLLKIDDQKLDSYDVHAFLRTMDENFYERILPHEEIVMILSVLEYLSKTTIIYQEVNEHILRACAHQWRYHPDINRTLENSTLDHLRDCIDICVLKIKHVTLDCLVQNAETNFVHGSHLFAHVLKRDKVQMAYDFAQKIRFNTKILSETIGFELRETSDFDAWKKTFKLGSLIDILTCNNNRELPKNLYANMTSSDFFVLCSKSALLEMEDIRKLGLKIPQQSQLNKSLFMLLKHVEQYQMYPKRVSVSQELWNNYQQVSSVIHDLNVNIDIYFSNKPMSEEIELCL